MWWTMDLYQWNFSILFTSNSFFIFVAFLIILRLIVLWQKSFITTSTIVTSIVATFPTTFLTAITWIIWITWQAGKPHHYQQRAGSLISWEPKWSKIKVQIDLFCPVFFVFLFIFSFSFSKKACVSLFYFYCCFVFYSILFPLFLPYLLYFSTLLLFLFRCIHWHFFTLHVYNLIR